MQTILWDVVNGVLSAMMTLVGRAFEVGFPLVAAGVVLLVGIFLAHWVRYFADYVMLQFKLDHLCEQGGVSPLLHRFGMGRSPTKLIGFVAYWLVLLAFLLPAADIAHLGVVREFLREVVAFTPKLVGAVLIMGGGLYLSHFFGGIVRNAAVANHLEESDFLGWATYWVMAVFSGLMALQRLDIDTSVLMEYPAILVGALCLGVLLLLLLYHKGLASALKGGSSKVLHAVKTKV